MFYLRVAFILQLTLSHSGGTTGLMINVGSLLSNVNWIFFCSLDYLDCMFF